MSEIRSLNAYRADRERDNTLISPVESLREAIAEIESGETVAHKALVLLLDTGEDGSSYNVMRHTSNMRCSEMLALLEVAKTKLLKEMGFIPDV